MQPGKQINVLNIILPLFEHSIYPLLVQINSSRMLDNQLRFLPKKPYDWQSEQVLRARNSQGDFNEVPIHVQHLQVNAHSYLYDPYTGRHMDLLLQKDDVQSYSRSRLVKSCHTTAGISVRKF